MMWRIYVQDYVKSHPTAGRWYARVGHRSGGALGPAVVAAGLVVAVPLVLITVAAVLTGLIVFLLLTLVGRVFALILGAWHAITGFGKGSGRASNDGRHNVRIIHR